MQLLKSLLFTAMLAAAASANALVLSDVHSVNAALVNGESLGFRFNLANHGYNHRTDTITSLKLSFDFREIVETEENLEDIDDMPNWEFIIFYSRIFDGRSIYADIDTGITSFLSYWNKNYECQVTDYNEDYDEICVDNLDLDGIMSSWIVPYTDNLWLGEARLDAEITRIPEPTPVLLFGLGLLGVAARYNQITKKISKQ